MANKPCLHEGCTELSPHTYCPLHMAATRKQADTRRGPRPWYGSEWRRIRKAALKQTPYCVRCGATADLTVDHIAPRTLAAGVQVLCRKCNSAKGGRV